MLGGVDVPRAEKDGEGRHAGRDQKRRVAQEVRHVLGLRHHDGRVFEQQAKARRDRLKLQRDVGHDRITSYNVCYTKLLRGG